MNKVLLAILFFIPHVAHAEVLSDETAGSAEEITEKDIRNILQEADLVQKAAFRAKAEELNRSIKRFPYNPDRIVRVKLRENTTAVFQFDEPMHSPIVGAGDEFFKIKAWISGKEFEDIVDGVVINDKFMVKAISGKKDTNITFLAKSGRIYTYMVRSLNFDSAELGDLLIHAQLPDDLKEEVELSKKTAAENKRKNLREAAKRINSEQDNAFMKYMKEIVEGKININYEALARNESSRGIMPWAVFDNGVRTFFNFDGVTETNQIPAIMKVVDGIDVPVTKKDAYMIDPSYKGWVYVEGISQDGWTLKIGDNDKGKIICIKPTVGLREFHNEPMSKATTPMPWPGKGESQ